MGRELIFVIWAVIGFIFAYLARNLAEKKGFNGMPYFWLAFFLNILGVLITIGLPDRIVQGQNQQIIQLLSEKR